MGQHEHLRVRRRARLHTLHEHFTESTERLRDEICEILTRRSVESVEGVIEKEEVWARCERTYEEYLPDLTRRDRSYRTVEERVETEANDEVTRCRGQMT